MPFDEGHKKSEAALDKMSLTSDVLFEAVMRSNIPAVQRVLQIILQDDMLKVESVHVQEDIKNVYGRSVRLDVLAYLQGKDLANIELKNEQRGAHPKRLRYHASLIDASKTIEAGQDFSELTTTYIIFIDINNSRNMRKAVSHYVPTELETGEVLYEMGMHYLYVNGRYQGTDEIGMLISDLYQTTSGEIQISELREAVKQIKETEKGREYMCEIMKELIQEEILEEKAASAAALYSNGVDIAIIARSLQVSEDQVKEWILSKTQDRSEGSIQ